MQQLDRRPFCGAEQSPGLCWCEQLVSMDVHLKVPSAHWQQWFAVGSLVWLLPAHLVPHTLALMGEEDRLLPTQNQVTSVLTVAWFYFSWSKNSFLSIATSVCCQREADVASKDSVCRVEHRSPTLSCSSAVQPGGCSRVCKAVHRLLVLLLTVRPNVSAVRKRPSASPAGWCGGLLALTEEKAEGL